MGPTLLYFLASLLALLALFLPPFAVALEVGRFDAGQNKSMVEVVMDWTLQFLSYVGLLFLLFISLSEAYNYEAPTKKNLVFLSLPGILTDSELNPNTKYIDNFNGFIVENQKVFLVLTDKWAHGKDYEQLNIFVQKGLKIDAEVVGILPEFEHSRTKASKIAVWLQEDKRDWDSITIIDTQYLAAFTENQILVDYGFEEYKKNLLISKIEGDKHKPPEISGVAPTQVKLNVRPDFGGRRLLIGHEAPASRKEAEGENGREIHRPSATDVPVGRETEEESREADSWLKKQRDGY